MARSIRVECGTLFLDDYHVFSSLPSSTIECKVRYVELAFEEHDCFQTNHHPVYLIPIHSIKCSLLELLLDDSFIGRYDADRITS
jgi:hypothetical protein